MIRILIPVAAFVIALPLAASAFKEGPYPNVTGGLKLSGTLKTNLNGVQPPQDIDFREDRSGVLMRMAMEKAGLLGINLKPPVAD